MVGTTEDGEAGREGGIGIHLWKDECVECLELLIGFVQVRGSIFS